jgi:PAS domain S-box-containing protein
MASFSNNVDGPSALSLSDTHDLWWQNWFEQCDDAQIVCQWDGFVLEANRKAGQLLGFTPEKTRHNPFLLFDLIAPAEVKKLTEFLRRGNGRQETMPGLMLKCTSQLQLVADLQITPLDKGCSLLTFRDASRRWRMETHLQRLMAAMDTTPDVIYLTDADGKLAFVNSVFQIVTGYNIEDALGKDADFLRAPEAKAQILAYKASLQMGKEWKGELLNRRGDGTQYPVEVTLSPIFNKRGERMGFAALERDLSGRNRLQEDLNLQRNYVLSIINSLDVAIYTLDRNYLLSHINDGWMKMPRQHGWLDVAEPPKAGQSFWDLVKDPEKKHELNELFDSVMETGRPQELQVPGPKGYHWAVKIAPWMHEGAVRGLLYAVSDQTKYHELQKQLYQAQKMETIGALAAGVAHDFNNLLQAIRGNTGLLLLDGILAPAELRRRLEQIDQAAVRAAEITQQLLTFSRAGEDTNRVADLNEVIREAGQLAQRSMRSKVELRLAPCAQPVAVRLDSTRAQQVLLNLYVNAQDAMPNGGKITIVNSLIRLSLEQAAKARCAPGALFACCSVTDTGTGIPQEVLPRIFDPFFTTKEKGKGTGLGLAIVQTVISQAKGFIEVESTPGKGTTFHLYLPVALEAVREGVKAEPLSKIGKNTGTILVVDDLDLVLDFTRTFLKTAGYEVLVAKSAEEALKILENQGDSIDLLFTDHNMAGMSGHQLIEESARLWPNLKFILATGYLDGPERQQIEMQAGIRILDKPFSMHEAAEMVVEMLGNGRK